MITVNFVIEGVFLETNILSQLESILWAKSNPYKPLRNHLLETGFVAQILITKGCFVPLKIQLMYQTGLSSNEIIQLVGYLAAVHDLGKASPFFIGNGAYPPAKKFIDQHDLHCSPIPHFRHEKHGAALLRQIWKNKNRFSGSALRRSLSYIIENHHQGKIGVAGLLLPDHKDCWSILQDNIEEKLWQLFQPPSSFVPQNMDAFCMLLLGIVVAADWIASGDLFAGTPLDANIESARKDIFNRTQTFLQDNYLLHQSVSNEIHTFTDLWSFIPRSGMRPLQSKTETIFQQPGKPLAMILEAPMGEGKTEAALYAASQLAKIWKKEGFYVALPTAATSNQMYRRVNDMLKRLHLPQAKLMHSMAWLVNKDNIMYHGEEALQAVLWTEPMRLGLIAPFAVGTVDQVMMAALRVKYGVLRLAGLTDKVLIIDELHSYDAYMSEIIVVLLKWCRALQIPVVMLSATLPQEKKEEYAKIYDSQAVFSDGKAYPCITAFYGDEEIRQFPVAGSHQTMDAAIKLLPILNNMQKIAVQVVQQINDTSGCYCLLCNTVKEAQQLYQEVKILDRTLPVLLFHARFHAKRRNELEEECLQKLSSDPAKRSEKLLVIATQVIEQSLDIDFDYLFTDICPMDLLFQRIGRVWRHKETKRPFKISGPSITILVPKDTDFGATGVVYPPILLEKTMNLLRDKSVLHIPQDIPKLVDDVYSDVDITPEQLMQWAEYKLDEELQGSSAQGITLPEPSAKKFWLSHNGGELFDDDDPFVVAKTRMGEESLRLSLVSPDLFYTLQKQDWISKKMAQIILQYSVSVSRRQIQNQEKLCCKNGIEPIQGKGLLYGVRIYPAEDGICELEDGSRFILDNQLGFLIGGKTNGV